MPFLVNPKIQSMNFLYLTIEFKGVKEEEEEKEKEFKVAKEEENSYRRSQSFHWKTLLVLCLEILVTLSFFLKYFRLFSV